MTMSRLSAHLRTFVILTCVVTFAVAKSPSQEKQSRTLVAHPGGTLRVVLGAGSVRISPWDKSEVNVNATESDRDLTISQSGNTIQVQCSADVDVQLSVPRRFNLDVISGSGDIETTGAVEGTFKGKTSGGEVTLRDFEGDVTVATGGGGVSCGNVKGKVVVRSAGGDLHLGNIEGDVNLETDGGDVEIQNVGKSVAARTSGGNITTGKIGGNARLMTSGGNIEAGPIAGESTLESSGGNIIVHGAIGKMSASTSGGDLTLEQIHAAFEGSTSAGNIDAIVTGESSAGRCDGSLSSGGGNISLAIPPDANTTITARVHEVNFGADKNDQSGIASDFQAESFKKDEHSGEILAVYRLNKGTGAITLDASGGSITIRKGKH